MHSLTCSPYLQLYLLAAKAADDCGLNNIAYEFFKEAPILYEEEIVDSRKQVCVCVCVH